MTRRVRQTLTSNSRAYAAMVRGHEKSRQKATPAGRCDPLEQRQMLSGTRLVELVAPGDPNFPAAAPIGDPTVADSAVSHDLTTGQTVVTEAAAVPADLRQSIDAVDGTRPAPGPQDWPQNDIGVHGNDDRVEVADPRFTPHSHAVKLEMTFPNGAQYIGSGIMQSSFHVLTAGHCIYSASDGGWATSIRVSPAQDDVDAASGDNGRWYGTANATNLRSYTGWTSTATPDWDWGLITLDRTVGNNTGWAGAQWTSSNSVFNGMPIETRGYPGELQNGTHMYHVDGPATNATDLRINYLMDTTGGQSGSGIIRDDGNNRTVGVVAYAGTSTNFGPRMTEGRFNDLYNNWIPGDSAPTDRPDLVDWDEHFNTGIAFLSTNTASAGQPFSATHYVRNNGTATASAYTVSFYASTNTIISTGDTFLGSVSMGSLGEFSWDTATLSTTLPAMPEGSYHIGYIIDSGGDNSEFLEGNNSGVIDDGQLTITIEDLDDTLAEANFIALDVPAAADLDYPEDVDLYQFTAEAGDRLGFDIDSPGDFDSYLRLFDASGVELDANDDGTGPAPEDYFYDSYFTYTFAEAGTYYVGVGNLGLRDDYDPVDGTRTGTGSATGIYSLTVHDLDDQASEATPLSPGVTAFAGIGSDFDVDLFALSVQAGDSYVFDIDTPDSFVDTELRLFDASGSLLDVVDDDFSGTGPSPEENEYDPLMRYVFASSGTVYLGVAGYSNDTYDPLTGIGDEASFGGTGQYQLTAFRQGSSPVIDRLNTSVRYVENKPPTLFARSARVADADTVDFGNARLEIEVGGFFLEDVVGIMEGNGVRPGTGTFGTGSGQITIAQSGAGDVPVADVNYLGSSLSIVFYPGTTRQQVQRVLRQAAYQNTSELMDTSARSISVLLTEGTGERSVPAVTPLNLVNVADRPTIEGVLTDAVFTEGGGPVPLTGGVTITDVDTFDWGGATLDVVVRTPRQAEDLIVFDPSGDGGVSVSGTGPGAVISVDGFDVATLRRGIEGRQMLIDFLPGSLSFEVERVASLIHFNHTGDNPTATKTFRFTLSDPDRVRGVAQETLTVNAINDPPTILNVAGRTVGATVGGGPSRLASSFTFADPDFGGGGGELTVAVLDPLTGDTITIAAGGGVSVSGSTVRFDGTNVGSVAGLGTPSMTVIFNTNATFAAVRSVGRRVAYEALPGTPDGFLDVTFDFTDEQGAAAPTATMTVNLSPSFAGGSSLAGVRGGSRAMDLLLAADDREDWWATL